MKKLLHSMALIGLSLLVYPQSVFAQAGAPPPITINPVVGFSSINDAAATLIQVVFWGGALLAFFFIFKGAFTYLTAGEDPGKTSTARQTIMNAVIGLVVLASIYVIFSIVIAIVPGLDQFFT